MLTLLHVVAVLVFPSRLAMSKPLMSVRYGCNSVPSGIGGWCDWLVFKTLAGCGNHGSDPVEEQWARRKLYVVKRREVPRTVWLSMRMLHESVVDFALYVLPSLPSSVVLLSGSEDLTLPTQVDLRWRSYNDQERAAIDKIFSSPLVERWCAENVVAAGHENKLVAIPTGFDRAKCAANDCDSEIAAFSPETPNKDRPLTTACASIVREGPQWELRRRIAARCLDGGGWSRFSRRPPYAVHQRGWLRWLSQHSFSFCVGGGGVDPSPKAFESLVAGVIPIVQRTGGPLDDAYGELPVVFLDDWNDESAVREEDLRRWRSERSDWFEDPTVLKQMLTQEYWWSRCLSGTSHAALGSEEKTYLNCSGRPDNYRLHCEPRDEVHVDIIDTTTA